MDDLFKLFPENLLGLKSGGVVGENFDMDGCVDVDFDIKVTKSSSLTGKEILVAVCSVEEQNDTEDEERIEKGGEEPLKTQSLSDVANAINLIEKLVLI